MVYTGRYSIAVTSEKPGLMLVCSSPDGMFNPTIPGKKILEENFSVCPDAESTKRKIRFRVTRLLNAYFIKFGVTLIV